MYKLVITQILNTIPKDVTLYLNDESSAYKISSELAKDSTMLDVVIYKNDKVVKKFKNETNTIRFWGVRK